MTFDQTMLLILSQICIETNLEFEIIKKVTNCATSLYHIPMMSILKVSKSQKQIKASWILPKKERWGNFQYIKLPQRSFFGRIQDNIFFFEIF